MFIALLPKLEFHEGLVISALLGLILYETVKTVRSKLWVSIYKPTLFIAAILLYYVIVGPLVLLSANGEALYRQLAHRELLIWGWIGSAVFYGSTLFGFYFIPARRLPRRMIPSKMLGRLHFLGLRLCQIGLVLFAIVAGINLILLLNPLTAFQNLDGGGRTVFTGVDVGGLRAYFTYGVNFLIPGFSLMFATWLRDKKYTREVFGWFLVSVLIYISLGFRYRLVLFIVPPFILWFMSRRTRPSLSLLALFLAGFITFNGFIGLTRQYGKGLNLALLSGENTQNFFSAGFQESAVFFTTSGIIQQTPKEFPYIGLEPIVTTIFFPIPRAFFPSKPDGAYLKKASQFLYRQSEYGGEIGAAGAFYLGFAEYYLMAGWFSLVTFSVLLGWISRKLWNWFLFRKDEPLAQCIYILNVTFLYIVVSRGYLPQIVLLFCYSVVPLFWLYGRWSQSVNFRATSSSITRS